MTPNMIKTELTSAQDSRAYSDIDYVLIMKSALEKKAACRLELRGTSMSPFIKDGDVVTVSRLIDCPASLGRAVAFISPQSGKIVIHRIISLRNGSYLIKGDNVLLPDGLILRENILGSVTKIEREGKAAMFGFGPERFLIAFLSRMNALVLIDRFWKLVLFPVKRLLS